MFKNFWDIFKNHWHILINKFEKEIIAFLNTNSGTIYIGIENKYGYEYKLESTTCYDEKGEIISINE